MLYRYRGYAGLEQYRYFGKDFGNATISSADDVLFFTRPTDRTLFEDDRWQGFVCTPQTTPDAPQTVANLIAYPAPSAARLYINNYRAQKVEITNTYDPEHTTLYVAKDRKDRTVDELDWTPIEAMDEFVVDSYYPQAYGSNDAYYDSVQFNYGAWKYKVVNRCLNAWVQQIQDVTLVDYGLHLVDAQGRQTKWLKDREFEASLINGERNHTLVVVPGWQQEVVKDSLREELALYTGTSRTMLYQNWTTPGTAPEVTNTLIFQATQLMDDDFDEIPNKMLLGNAQGAAFRLEDNSLVTDAASTTQPLATALTSHLNELLADYRTGEVTLLLQNFSALYLEPLAAMIATDYGQLLDAEADDDDAEEEEPINFRIVLANPVVPTAYQQRMYNALEQLNAYRNVVVMTFRANSQQEVLYPGTGNSGSYPMQDSLIAYTTGVQLSGQSLTSLNNIRGREASYYYLYSRTAPEALVYCTDQQGLPQSRRVGNNAAGTACYTTSFLAPTAANCFTIDRDMYRDTRAKRLGYQFNENLQTLSTLDQNQGILHLIMTHSPYEATDNRVLLRIIEQQ